MNKYDEFIVIIKKLADKYDPALFTCIKYENGIGLTCNICKRDEELQGF